MTVDKYKGHTRVTVDAPLWKVGNVSLRAYSSAWEARPLIPEEWVSEFATVVSRRMADNHGADKGRVLYIGRRTRDDERAPLAVLAWHCPSNGPLEVLDLGVALAVRQHRLDLTSVLGASLLSLLRAVAAHKEVGGAADRLAWITDDDHVARRAYEQWGFVGLKAGARPPQCTTRHYLRRIEP
jgi:hypothetical protein